MPFKTINGLRIYYEVHGDGEPLILLHHGFGSMRIWDYIFPGMVAAGYQVVAYDRRGYGRSEDGADFFEFYESERYRPESVEELRLLKRHLEIESCHLVGQCEGGVIAVDYAAQYPYEVKTLTAASTQCYSELPMTELLRRSFVPSYHDLDPHVQAKLTAWHGNAAEVKYNHFARYGGAYGAGWFDLRPVLPMVACPSLVLYPDRSALFDVDQAVAFYRHLPKGELAVFPKCGHNTYEQRPEDYLSTVLAFLSRHRGGDFDSRPSVSCLA